MADESNAPIRVVPFRGGTVTAREKILLQRFEGWEEYSMVQNMRPQHPGFRKRLGVARHCTTADGSVETLTLYQFSKGSRTEHHFYAQRLDGSVIEATDNPPTVTTGAFGTDVLGTTTNPLPATWGNINDACLFTDGTRQQQIYFGSTTPVLSFIVFKDTTVPNIPEVGEDYSVEVADGRSSTVAVLDNLGTNEYFFVRAPVPIKSITVTVTAANGNASTLTMQYWKGTWSTVAITDNTASGGDTLAQTGSVTWTAQSDEIPHYLFGESGFWYKFKVSAALDAEVEVSAVTFDNDWQSLPNVWDGVLTEGIEAKVYNAEQLKYSLYSTSSITLGSLDTDDYLYVGFIDPLVGMYLDVGGTPNITDATVTGSSNISFHDGSTGRDFIRTTDANFRSAGFEEGQEIVISGTTNNNITIKIIQVTSNTIYVETGKLTSEMDQSATIQINGGPITTVLDLVEVWTGDAWTSLASDLTDGPGGLTQSGFVTWDRTDATPQPTQFTDSPFYAYWYRISFDKKLSNKVNIGILGMPYFDISDLGNAVACGVWKDRSLYAYHDYGQYLHVTARNRPTALNGPGYGVLEAGDGRRNRIRVSKQFYNEVIVWQEEKGEEGGCTTLFEGYDPSTYGKLLISSRIGIMNGKSAAVVDGVLTSQETDKEIKTLAFWLSRYGVAVTDGQTASLISDGIHNYFDPQHADCIRRGYEDKMWLHYDSADNVIRIGLVSGSSATVPNVFPVFDLVDWSWSFDSHAEPLSCMIELEAASGDVPVLQYGGGADDGYVYRLNTGTDDIVGASPTTTAIDSYIDMERDQGGNYAKLRSTVIRCKSQAVGDITYNIYTDTETATTESIALLMTAETAGNAYRRNRWKGKYNANHFTMRFQNNTAGQGMYLLDVGHGIHTEENVR